MALKTFQHQPAALGQFDVEDGYLSSILGGEIGTLTALPRGNTATEKAAYDVHDGYTNMVQVKRAAITTNISSGTLRPLWLLDEGTAGYGTLFGQVIGTPAGLSTTGSQLGPHTAAASGKVTAWNVPGLYGVTLDAADTDASLGLVLANSSLVPGKALYAMSNGKLTPTSLRGVSGSPVVARFVEFESAPFLVTTPASLVGAAEALQWAVINYYVES